MIEIEGLSKVYMQYRSNRDMLFESISPFKKKRGTEFKALNNISFSVNKGETFGIIGTNGAGKSTLLKLITGVTSATSGSVSVNGKIAALLELGAGFNIEYTGLKNIYLNGMMMGYSKAEMNRKVDKILSFADIGDFINQPVKNYSSGMFARLAFAVAINVDPEVLIVDEALSVGDIFFQNKCYKKFEELKEKGTTILFVSHDIYTVRQMCDRVLWVENGNIQLCGNSVEVCNAYTNSIMKRYNAEEEENNKNNYKINNLDEQILPPLSFSPESILNDDIEIISCFIEDENKNSTNVCHINKNYSVVVVYKSKIDIEDCIVGFVIETAKGLWIINSNSSMGGNKGSFKTKKNTINRVEFQFMLPALMKGEYVLGAAVSKGTNQNFEVLTWLYNILAINIINPNIYSGIVDPETKINIYSKDVKSE